MINLVPAYGRDYKNVKDLKADFNADKDFIIADVFHPYCGKYANRSDLKSEERVVHIHYSKNTKVTVINI